MAAFLATLLVIAGIIGFGAIVMALADIMADGPETSETRSGAAEGSHREQDFGASEIDNDGRIHR